MYKNSMENTTLWPVSENTAEVMTEEQSITGSNDFETVTFGTPNIMQLLHKIGSTIGYTSGSIGVIANAVVLTVLIRARRKSGSHVNTLIINQSLMDFLACCFIVLSVILHGTGTLVYDGSRSPFADSVICVLLDTGAPAGVCMTAGKVGLVVITLERYSKVIAQKSRSW